VFGVVVVVYSVVDLGIVDIVNIVAVFEALYNFAAFVFVEVELCMRVVLEHMVVADC
jgi:hypothetical protein